MKQTLKFKTNIKCMGCVSQVRSVLDETVGANNWEVDLQSADKQLTVKGVNLDADLVVAAIAEVGFKAEAESN